MERELAALIDRLAETSSFEEAAASALDVMLTRAAEGLEAAGLQKAFGRVLRGMVHLRPADGYRALVSVEADTRAATPEHEEAALLPSATVWKWLRAHRSPVAVEVSGAQAAVIPCPSGAPRLVGATHAGASLKGTDTIQRFRARAATHVLVLPLRLPGGAIGGMVSIEAWAPVAVTADDGTAGEVAAPWVPAAADLQRIADLFAPHLASLPLAQDTTEPTDALMPVVGRTMTPIVRMMRVFAQQDETILITGPTGAGKTRLAQWSHARSRRNAGPFVAVDLLTVPEDMQMGELFGWKKGAFTGAVRDQAGCIERADRGTLFIDEIDKLSLRAQAGLLTLLEERRYRVLGDPGAARKADVRFLIGTNADLQSAVREGRFREDLYYRINVLPVRLPSLSERPDEVASWANFMVQRRHVEQVPTGRAGVSAEAALALSRAPWPGNLRQLDNVIRRAYTLALVDLGGVPDDVTVQASHIERALSFEFSRDEPVTGSILWRAALHFAEAAEDAGQGALPIELTEGFRGFVLAAATARTGSKEDAYRLLGKEALLRNRNHHKPFRRDLERALELSRAMGDPTPEALTTLLD